MHKALLMHSDKMSSMSLWWRPFPAKYSGVCFSSNIAAICDHCIPKELTIFSSEKINVDDRIFLRLSVRLRRRFFHYSFWYEAMNFILTVSFPEWLYSYQGIYLPSSSQNHNPIELSLKLCCLWWHLDDFCPIVILKLSPAKPVEDLLTFGFSNPPWRRTHSKSFFFSGNL